MATYQRDIFKIYAVVGLSCLLLTVSLYWFGFKPLSDRLHAEHSHEIKHLLASGHSLIRSVLDKYTDLARQSASRTAIRNKQVAYLNGKVTRSDLIAFSAPKLADAMNANSEIVGIQRHGPDGKIMFNVGMTPPAEAVSRCDLASLKEIQIQAPVNVNGVTTLLYCSPIIDQVAGYVGSDVLLFDDVKIQQVVDVPQKNLGSFAIVHRGKIIYWPSELQDAGARDALEECLKHVCTRQNDVNHNYIFDSQALHDVNWQLFVVINRANFFSDIERQSLILVSVIIFVLVLVFVLTVLALRPVIQAMLREKELFELSHHDGLTGLYNHAYMQELLDHEVERSKRYDRVFSVLMFDLDHFKDINDTYGHQTGDLVLKHVSDVTLQTIRDSDSAARYGGEEFFVILPEADSANALILAERLRSNISATVVSSNTGDISVTISVGVLTCDGCEDRYDTRQIIAAADQAMYASKNNGRDLVTAVILSKDDKEQSPA